jgi:putative inorganic carbon (HCO3(-)) transporter
MLLCALAALGSQSRGALLALTAMTVLLWWRGKNKMSAGIILLAAAPLMILFMPDSWTERMNTISEFETDRSAMGRFSAWWTAWGIALHHPFGAGFNIVRPELVAIYSPYPDFVYAAHSIYFLVLGNHGFIGLALFLSLWLVTWNSAAWIRREGTKQPETKWCSDLGAMCQVSLIGYAVGGAFLSLSYFDLPYNIMAIVVLTPQMDIQQGLGKRNTNFRQNTSRVKEKLLVTNRLPIMIPLAPIINLISPANRRACLSVLIFHRVLPSVDPLFPGEPTAQLV